MTALEKTGELFQIESTAGTITADSVILATSLYSQPFVPRAAERIPDGIAQIHTADYRNPAQLPPGGVIVVGSGQSGCQIAEDLHLAGRKVHMVTGNAPRCARFYRGRDVVDWLADIGQYDITIAHDGMAKKKHDTNHYLTGRDGGRDIDLRKFALEGMALYGRMTGVSAGKMLFETNLKSNLDSADRVYNGINALIDRHIAEKGIHAPAGGPYVALWEPQSETTELDFEAEDVTSVIWATGFTLIGPMSDYRSSMAPAIRSSAAASPASRASMSSACPGSGPGGPAGSSQSARMPNMWWTIWQCSWTRPTTRKRKRRTDKR